MNHRIAALEAEGIQAREALQKASIVERRLIEENSDMERELIQAQERWRQQIRKAEQVADQFRKQVQAQIKEANVLTSEKARLEAALRDAIQLEKRAREENA